MAEVRRFPDPYAPNPTWRYVYQCTGRADGFMDKPALPGCGAVWVVHGHLCTSCGGEYTLHKRIARWVKLPSTWWRPLTWGLYRREFKPGISHA